MRAALALALASTLGLGACAYTETLADEMMARIGLGAEASLSAPGNGTVTQGLTPVPVTVEKLPAPASPTPQNMAAKAGAPVDLLAEFPGHDYALDASEGASDAEAGCLALGDSLIVARDKLFTAGFSETEPGLFAYGPETIALNRAVPDDVLIIRSLTREAPQDVFYTSPAARIFCGLE